MRDERIDVLRTVAILSVVLGHAVSAPFHGKPAGAPHVWGYVFTLVATFNVPLFLFLSGYLTKATVGLRWLGGRAWRLLLPYAAWSAVQWFLWFRGEGPGYVLDMLLDPQKTNALWFLPALFLCSAAIVLTRGWTPALVVAGLAATVFTPVAPVFGLDRAVIVFPFFVAGHLAARWKWRPGWLALLAPLFVAATWHARGEGLLWTFPDWYRDWAKTFTADTAVEVVAAPLRAARVAVALSLSAVLAWVAGFRGRDVLTPPAVAETPGVVRRALAWIGLNSLGIYLTHIVFLRLTVGAGHVAVLSTFAASLAAACALTWVLSQSPWTAAVFLGSGRAPWTRPARPVVPEPALEPESVEGAA